MTEPRKAELLERLHDIGGVRLEITCSRAVKARRLDLVPEDDPRTVCCKILYLGSPNKKQDGLHIENDGYTYTELCSPFPEEPDRLITYGLFRDKDNNIWTDYYSNAYLRFPEMHKSNIELRVFVPKILAEKSPILEIKCMDRTICSTVLNEPGEQRIDLDIGDCGSDLAEYMTDVRRQQAIMLDEFGKACTELGIKAYLICGGLIGVTRDGDLLPWDDDLDLAMTRTDYEILNSKAEELWPKGSSFEWITKDRYGDDVFVDFMTRFVYMEESSEGSSFTKLGSKGRQDLRGHQAIDIYILDNACNSEFRQKIKAYRIMLLYLLCSAHRGDEIDLAKYPYYSGFKGLAIKAALQIGKRLKLSTLLKRYDRLVSSCRNNRSESVFQSNGYYLCIPMLFRRDWFGEGTIIETEAGEMLVPDDPDSFLRRMYGDYLKYPATWDRMPSHFRKEDTTCENG